MVYDEKTQEIDLDDLDEILSEGEAEADSLYEYDILFEELLAPSTDAFEAGPPSEPIVAGVGVYRYTNKRRLKNAVATAAVRHLLKAHALLKNLDKDDQLLPEESATLRDIEGFLIRNSLL